MVVSAIGQEQNSSLSTIIKSTAIGTAAGYSLKYLWPVTPQEDDFNRKVMINYCRKVTNKAKAEDLRANGIKTLAQDCFVKMIDSKDKNAFNSDSLAKKVAQLGGENSFAGKEFRAIVRNVNETSNQMFKRWGTAYHIMLKVKRPTIPFLVAGAGVGFLAGFTHNILKTDA
jgi:hypothetical protein